MKDEKYDLVLKARMMLHGHRDKNCFSVRRGLASAELSIATLVLVLAQILNF